MKGRQGQSYTKIYCWWLEDLDLTIPVIEPLPSAMGGHCTEAVGKHVACQGCGLPGKGENINHLVSKSTILNLPANWHPRNLPGKELGAPEPLNRTLICLPMDLKDNMQKQ